MAPLRIEGEEREIVDAELDYKLKKALPTNWDDTYNTLSEKLCGEMVYSIICGPKNEHCCSSADYNIAWTTVDPSTWSGRILYEFALFNWTVPWLEWKGICDLKIKLPLNLTSLTNFCYNDSEIRASLSRLLQKVSHLASQVGLASIF